MKKTLKRVLPIICVLFVIMICNSCVGFSIKDDRKSDAEVNFKLDNAAPKEFAVYIDGGYRKTIRPGQKMGMLIEGVDPVGTVLTIDLFLREKVDDLSKFPTNADAKYYSFSKVVRPVGHHAAIVPIYIRALSEEDVQSGAGVNFALVRFTYKDYPRIDASVSVFTGSTFNQFPIVRMQNGETVDVPMPVGLTPISVEYSVSGKNIQRSVYPQNERQRNDQRFLVAIYSDVSEAQHFIPMIKDIFKIDYVSSPVASQATLRAINGSSIAANIRISSSTQSEIPIKGNDSFVLRGNKKDFKIDSGVYSFKAVDALGGGYEVLGTLDDVNIDGGMKYFWYITDQKSTFDGRVDMNVSQQITNYFQSWTLDTSVAEARISLKITSTADQVLNSQRHLGISNRNGQLILANIDIGNFIRGLSTVNARKVNLALIAEKDGYETSSQQISAHDLLQAGASFRPDKFNLVRKNTSMEYSDFIIGDPIID